MLMAGLLTSSIALQKVFKGSDEYATDISDQTRVMDYISRDARRALTVDTSVPNKVTMTIPLSEYPNDHATVSLRGQPIPPTITGGKAAYGAPVTVAYYIEGSNFIREEAGQKGTIAAGVIGFTPIFQTLDNNLEMTLTFRPRFRTTSTVDMSASTKIGIASSRRNAIIQ